MPRVLLLLPLRHALAATATCFVHARAALRLMPARYAVDADATPISVMLRHAPDALRENTPPHAVTP